MLSQMSHPRMACSSGRPTRATPANTQTAVAAEAERADAPPSATAHAARVELRAVVPDDLRGERFDRAAARMFPQLSRSELAGWIRGGAATLDGRVVKPRIAVRGGEQVCVVASRAPRLDWHSADEVAFEVVHEDAALVVVDKPPGLVVHPGAGNPRRTLVNGLLGLYPELAHLPRAGLVHRLDKNTSGLLVVARNAESRHALGKAMLARRIDRRYLAVAEGRMVAGGPVDLALGRDPRNRLRQTVRADGRPALTHVRVRKRYAAHTLVEARLETGRTHQIRVHLAATGHPLVGDRRYGARGVVPPGADPEQAACVREFPRQALHAFRLGFVHPASGKQVSFSAPLPADIADLLDALGPVSEDGL